LSAPFREKSEKMRTHLGCWGQVDLGTLSQDAQQRLQHVEATWLEFVPESMLLEVRHVQPDNRPALPEIAGELIEFLSQVSDDERAQVPGGTLYYRDEAKGQHVRLKVWKGGFLSIAWARLDYTHANWEPYRSQPVSVVPEPYQRLNGKFSFEGVPTAADDIRELLGRTAGLYSEGDFEIVARIDRVEVALRDVNASVLPLVYALQVLAKPGSLEGEIDVSSFRAGDLEECCRFAFRGGAVRLVRPSLWGGDLETETPPRQPLERLA
jgi:hypothetical protein